MPTPARAQTLWVGSLARRVLVAVFLLSTAFALRAFAADTFDEELPPPPAPPAEDLIPPLPKRPRPPRPPSTDWAMWNDIERFRGYSFCRRVEESRKSSSMSSDRSFQEDISTGTFELQRGKGTTWTLVSGHIVGSHHAVSSSDRRDYHGKSGHDAAFDGDSSHFGLTLDTKRGTWSFYAYGDLLQPYTYTWWLSARTLTGIAWEQDDRVGSELKKESAHFSTNGKLPTGVPTQLNGRWVIKSGTLSTGRSDYLGLVTLAPEYKDVELVVDIEGVMPDGAIVPYEKWIPRGTPGGGSGSRLKVKARLQDRDGGAVNATVENFSFVLNDTSREPGVCLNYPRLPASTGEPAAPDLKFAPGGETDAERQQLDMISSTDEPGHPSAEARIDCFDFGAWSDLTVIAELTDGRTITGHLKGVASAIKMSLPKRSGSSFIADAWKAEHAITAGDADDAEKLPSAGKAPGDGFTLYEEYRGFIENGKHLEGDPAKIDFFVRNFIGGDARPGIWLFADLTGAEVHHRLRTAEFDSKERVMNANHQRGAHKVDQHGVYLRTEAGRDGGAAVFSTADLRGRPFLCTGIFVQPRDAETSVTTSENLPASELVFAYDRIIVHELLHAVGVEHHGERDYRSSFQLVFADDPRNKTGKPVFWSGYSTSQNAITITDEKTGRDLAELLAPDLMLAREADRARFFDDFQARTRTLFQGHEGTKTTEFTRDQIVDIMYNDVFGHFYWYVGAEHGQCSGDEGCVTRYTFAKLYEKIGVPRAYYYISDRHTERAGLGLCRARAGTGINASGRNPQPRYGDTIAGWGACADWIVFNDAAPNEQAPTP